MPRKLVFIPIDEDKFLVKNSNNLIVNKSEIETMVAIEDINSDSCVRGLYEGYLKGETDSSDQQQENESNRQPEGSQEGTNESNESEKPRLDNKQEAAQPPRINNKSK